MNGRNDFSTFIIQIKGLVHFVVRHFSRRNFRFFIFLLKNFHLSIFIPISRSIFVRCFYSVGPLYKFDVFSFGEKIVQHVTNIVTIYSSLFFKNSLFKFTNSIRLLNEYSVRTEHTFVSFGKFRTFCIRFQLVSFFFKLADDRAIGSKLDRRLFQQAVQQWLAECLNI